MDYTPRGATKRMPTVVLVGKGITFDTGGLDIKPSEGMLTMKRDMSGGGAVIATMAALRDVDCPVRVIGLVPAAENAVSGSAMRPGDVITHFGGSHLRGQQHRRRGPPRAGRRDGVRRQRARADRPRRHRHPDRCDEGVARPVDRRLLRQPRGPRRPGARPPPAASGENIWRMPLVADYEDKVASKIADGDNAAGGAGAITAALFLQHFAGDVPWAHIDFASAAESPTDRHEWTAGPSGCGPAPAADAGSAPTTRWPGSSDARPHRPLVARRRAGGGRGAARVLRRRDLARPVHRDGRAALQDLAPGAGGVVRGLLRLRHQRGARGVPAHLHRGRRRGARHPDHRQRRRSSSRRATSSRSPRAGTASRPPRASERRPVARVRPRGPTPSWRPAGRRRRAAAPARAPRARGSCGRGRGW